jgi:hypothetical protein
MGAGIDLITTPESPPDEASLQDFARAQGFDAAALGALFGTPVAGNPSLPLADGLAMPALEGLLGPERSFRSLELVTVTPKLGKYFGTAEGLLVVRAAEGQALPLEEGDVLLSIDGRKPDSPGHAFRILRSYEPGEKVKLGGVRERKPVTLEATVPAASASRDGGERRQPPARPAPPVPAVPPLPPAAGSA